MKTQSISKSKLKEIYPKVCDNYKTIIRDLVLWADNQVEIPEDVIQKAYEAANKEQKDWLSSNFKITSTKIQDRIKTWADVLKELNVAEPNILPWTNPMTKDHISQSAYAKIQCISKVLNEGWVPDFKNSNQYKYYPYFERKSHGWVRCSYGYCYADDWSVMGFGCFYKSSELAVYAGSQFIDIYKEFLPE